MHSFFRGNTHDVSFIHLCTNNIWACDDWLGLHINFLALSQLPWSTSSCEAKSGFALMISVHCCCFISTNKLLHQSLNQYLIHSTMLKCIYWITMCISCRHQHRAAKVLASVTALLRDAQTVSVESKMAVDAAQFVLNNSVTCVMRDLYVKKD